ncbi:nucleotidyltransferase family protein [Candidatus Uabimicrobium amorphum]|uniref:Uncharacterized protein n=1 Tax=Uabimicrobium amorphum TaxID=2596890 RepID=A0A5S9ITA3_UABAM|nr:nucleotidyltransferase family protein [Candidatus Uabimicrobium amorphum]BBM87709.1 hypothetical protein UABAM_06124 [Candidatus Uabimicrobium amorphum]
MLTLNADSLDLSVIHELIERPIEKRLLPWLHLKTRHRSDLTREQHEYLRQNYLKCLRKNMLLFQELQKLLSLFAAADIEVMPLKGLLLTARLYENLGSASVR